MIESSTTPKSTDSTNPVKKPSSRKRKDGDLQMLDALVTGFENSLRRHMPSSPYQAFYLWAISPENPQRDAYLQVAGITQFAKMTLALLDGLVDGNDWGLLTDLSVVINAYLIYETTSDNMAIGLGSARPHDHTFQLRRDTLFTFNDAMLKRLSGDKRSATDLLEPIQSTGRRISNFEQSLSLDKHVNLVQSYLSSRPDVSMDDLEYSTWPILVANIESCVDLVKSISSYQMGSIVQEGLVLRYQGVNKLLKAGRMTLSQLSNVGTHSILVMPTLAYYIVVLAEIVRPQRGITSLVADGTLGEAVYDAALLLRLLNDLGTEVCTLTAEEQISLLHRLANWRYRHSESAQTVYEVLMGVADESVILTRLHKDILFGEFNVGLYGLNDTDSVSDGITAFGRNIDYFVQLYTYHYAHLEEKLAIIDARLKTDTISELILRFVKFHERMYSAPFNDSKGEYAV